MDKSFEELYDIIFKGTGPASRNMLKTLHHMAWKAGQESTKSRFDTSVVWAAAMDYCKSKEISPASPEFKAFINGALMTSKRKD